MHEAEPIDEPNANHETWEGDLGHKENAGEDDAEKKTDDGHQPVESEPIQENPTNHPGYAVEDPINASDDGDKNVILVLCEAECFPVCEDAATDNQEEETREEQEVEIHSGEGFLCQVVPGLPEKPAAVSSN